MWGTRGTSPACQVLSLASEEGREPAFGPGYRVYFGKEGEQIVILLGKEGEQIVILLGGGTKQRRQNDIKVALERWEDYKQRKKQQKEKEKEEE